MNFEYKINRFKDYDDIASISGYVEGQPFEKEAYKNLLGGYHLKDKIKCCFSGSGRVCNTEHNHGYVVELNNGVVTVVGSECVYKLGSEEKLLKDVKFLKNEEKRQDKLQMLKDKIKAPLATYEEVSDSYERAKKLEEIASRFLDSMPFIVSGDLRQKVKSGNGAVVVTMVYERPYFDNGVRKIEREEVRTVVYRIKGLRFLNYELLTSLKRRISDAKGAVKAVDSINNNTSQRRLSDIANKFNAYQRQLKVIGEFERYYNEFMQNDFRFFTLLAPSSEERRELEKVLSLYSGDVRKSGANVTYKKIREHLLDHSGAVEFY